MRGIEVGSRVLVEVGLNTYKFGRVKLVTSSWCRVCLDCEGGAAYDWHWERVRPVVEEAA